MILIKNDIVKDKTSNTLKIVENVDGDIITLRYLHNQSDEFIHCTRKENLQLVERLWELESMSLRVRY